MANNEAFLRAICADVDNDTPRLVYADWLEEHATTAAQQPQAEFIRVQIELAQTPEFRDRAVEARYLRLCMRDRALRDLYRWDWLGDFPAVDITFRRGFASAGTFLLEQMRAHADAVLAHPLLDDLSIAGVDELTLPDLLACPWLGTLRGMAIMPGSSAWPEGRPIPPNWERLADVDCFSRLESLCLWAPAF